MSATQRQINAAASALLLNAAARDGVIMPNEVLDLVPEDVRAEAIEDATAALEAAEKASLIIVPGDLNG